MLCKSDKPSIIIIIITKADWGNYQRAAQLVVQQDERVGLADLIVRKTDP